MCHVLVVVLVVRLGAVVEAARGAHLRIPGGRSVIDDAVRGLRSRCDERVVVRGRGGRVGLGVARGAV